MEYDLDLIASEIEILNKLDHINIVKYLVMEFVEGMQISNHVK